MLCMRAFRGVVTIWMGHFMSVWDRPGSTSTCARRSSARSFRSLRLLTSALVSISRLVFLGRPYSIPEGVHALSVAISHTLRAVITRRVAVVPA